MKNKNGVFSIAILILFIIIAFTTAVNAEGKAYKIGMSLAITGPTSDAGNPISKGVEDWFKYVNETKLLGENFCWRRSTKTINSNMNGFLSVPAYYPQPPIS